MSDPAPEVPNEAEADPEPVEGAEPTATPEPAVDPEATSQPSELESSEPEPAAASEPPEPGPEPSEPEPAATSEPPEPEPATASPTAEAPAEPEAKEPLPAPPEDVEPAAGMAFSLLVGLAALSLLCVVSSVIAALVSPRLGGVQVQRNEQQAIEALEAIAAAQKKLQRQDLDGNGRPDFVGLGQLGMLGLIDPDLSSGLKAGYVFRVVVSELEPEKRWMAVAEPAAQERTGRRHFAINHSGGVYFRYRQAISLNNRTCAIPPNAMPLDMKNRRRY